MVPGHMSQGASQLVYPTLAAAAPESFGETRGGASLAGEGGKGESLEAIVFGDLGMGFDDLRGSLDESGN